MKGTISVTEAVRNFAEFINRIVYRGEAFTLERGGRPVARLVPVPQAGKLGMLPGLLDAAPRLDPEEAESLARDLAESAELLSPPSGRDPWES
jgi:antitoxin (DNA-binding transcriptional repressor) of toxin-antitoxin stability system